MGKRQGDVKSENRRAGMCRERCRMISGHENDTRHSGQIRRGISLAGDAGAAHGARPEGEQWTIGCEALDRDFAKFSAYKDYLPQLGIRSIRLQSGWAKCEREKGIYDFVWLDEPVDFALAHGLDPMLETDAPSLLP